MNLAADFFYDEVRDGFYIPGMMKRAWGASMKILSEIDRICKKYECGNAARCCQGGQFYSLG